MTARPPATASGWRPRRGAGRRHPEAVDACGVVLLGSDPPPGRTASLSGGRRRVAAGRAACQRAARVLRSATALRVTHRPPRGSDGSYGPCGPAWTRASRPSTTSQGPGAPPNSERRTGPEPPARDWGRGRRVPGGGAGCAVSLCRRRVDVLTEPTGGPFSRGRRGPFFSRRRLVDDAARLEGPITPFMGPSKEGTRTLHSVRPSTNLSKDMCAVNRPNPHERNGLTRI